MKYTVKQLCRFIGALFACITIGVSVVPYVIFLACWMVISIPLPATWFHKVEDNLWGFYQRMVVFFFEHYSGVEVYIDGEIPLVVENALVISNHQCMVDWIVADFLAIRQGMVGNMRFVFKNILKYYPLYGFGFGVHGGVFVKRNRTYNDTGMIKVLKTLEEREANIYFLIYPEGTRFSPSRKNVLEKSRTFAVKNGLKPLNQVLTPRIKAFDCAINSMKTYFNAVYDITIVYDGWKDSSVRCEPPNAFHFLMGSCKRIYINFERIPIDDVVNSSTVMPSNESLEGATDSMTWLHNRFELKDNLLDSFYKDENQHGMKEMAKQSFLPLSSTLPATAVFVLVNAFLLYSPLGRLLYLITALIGSVFGGVYSHMYF